MTLHFINYIGWLVIPGKAVGCCGVLIIYTWSNGGDSNYQYYTFFSSSSRQETVWLIIQIKITKKYWKRYILFLSVMIDFLSWMKLHSTFGMNICLTMPMYYFPHFEYFWFHCNVGLKYLFAKISQRVFNGQNNRI